MTVAGTWHLPVHAALCDDCFSLLKAAGGHKKGRREGGGGRDNLLHSMLNLDLDIRHTDHYTANLVATYMGSQLAIHSLYNLYAYSC